MTKEIRGQQAEEVTERNFTKELTNLMCAFLRRSHITKEDTDKIFISEALGERDA